MDVVTDVELTAIWFYGVLLIGIRFAALNLIRSPVDDKPYIAFMGQTGHRNKHTPRWDFVCS